MPIKYWARLQYGACYAGRGFIIGEKPAHVAVFYHEPFGVRHATDSLRVALFSIRKIVVR